MDPKAFERIERLNYVFGAVLILVCAFLTETRFSLGVSVGVLLTCLNFSVLRRLVGKLLTSDPDKRSGTAFFFIPKMAGMLGAVALALLLLPISPIGLGLGFSIFILSITVESIRFMTGATLPH
jgi:hypothetical protein